MTSVTIAAPDDWHVHLRDDHMLASVTPFTARCFRYALVMPNLVPPVTSTHAAVAYRQRILAAAGPQARADFEPLMTLYLNDALDVDDLLAGARDGVIAGAKYYPAGATTNSAAGGSSLREYWPVFDAMSEAEIPLLVHAESTDPEVDIFDREAVFLERQLLPVLERFPTLRVTVEHISTRAGLDLVRAHRSVAGSITPHHLTCDRSDVLANGLRPDLYCKPVLNSRADREALVEAAISGDPSFFLGTDSAPHPLSHKLASPARPGVFSAPYALEVVAELFFATQSLHRLEGFVSWFGADHYRRPRADATVVLTRRDEVEDEPLTEVTTEAGQVVTVFGVEAARRWRWEDGLGQTGGDTGVGHG